MIARDPAKLRKLGEHMIKLVPSARRLGREIAPVVGVDRAMERHSSADIEAGASESLKFAWVVSQQANSGAAKHLQHAGGDAVIAFIIVEPESAVGVERVEPSILQPIGSNLIGQAEAESLLLEDTQ